MILDELSEAERLALIWKEGDTLEIRSGVFCVTRSAQTPLEQQAGHRYVHFLFDLADTGEQMSGDMTLSSEIPNGSTLALLLRRGDEFCPIAWISMVNRAWCHTRFDKVPLYQNTERYKRLSEPPIVAALGPFAQLFWSMGRSLFTDCEAEEREIVNVLHGLLHRIASNHTFYWEGGGGTTTERKL